MTDTPKYQAFPLDPGGFYVQYNDTERSMLMTYRNAHNYAAIFGGKVVYAGGQYPMRVRIRRLIRRIFK